MFYKRLDLGRVFPLELPGRRLAYAHAAGHGGADHLAAVGLQAQVRRGFRDFGHQPARLLEVARTLFGERQRTRAPDRTLCWLSFWPWGKPSSTAQWHTEWHVPPLTGVEPDRQKAAGRLWPLQRSGIDDQRIIPLQHKTRSAGARPGQAVNHGQGLQITFQ